MADELKPEGSPGPEDKAPEQAKPQPPKPPAAKPAAAAPKAPPPPKPPAVMVTTPWESELALRLKERFPDMIVEASSYVGQNFLVASAAGVPAILDYLKGEEDFDYLVDITAVDWPKREARFDLVYIVYSFARNERLRIKTRLKDGEKQPSVTGLHLTADWLEREVFDMFGIEFTGHPALKRILMPDEWQGYPLRKDYSILQMDNGWVRENLGIESGQ